MRPRKFVWAGMIVLLLVFVSVSGWRFYCAECNAASSTGTAALACPLPDQSDYLDKNILDLSIRLLRCDRSTDHKTIAAIVTDIRKSGIRSAAISELLSNMLSYQAEIYQDRDKWEVLRLRAYILLTLGETGFPASAIPMLEDALAYVDNRMKVVELGAAIKIAGEMGREGSRFAKSMISAYNRVFSDEEFSLGGYETGFAEKDATTVQIEIIRSLGKICNKQDDHAVAFLTSVAATSGDPGIDRRTVAEAKRSLEIISQKDPAKLVSKKIAWFCPKENGAKMQEVFSSTTHPSYINARERKQLVNKDFSITDHHGAAIGFTKLIDRPTLLTFFYTSCQNEQKCASTISHLAALQDQLARLDIDNEVRLVALTLEPEQDTPEKLTRFLADRGATLQNGVMAIRLEPHHHRALIKELEVPVGYNSGWVNGHGIAAVLLDSDKRIVKQYDASFWNTTELLADLTRLVREKN